MGGWLGKIGDIGTSLWHEGERFFSSVGDWLDPQLPELPYTGGTEIRLTKPTDEPLIYGEVKNVTGVLVNSLIDDPDDGDDTPNDLLYLQIVFSTSDIEQIGQAYFDGILTADTRYDDWAYLNKPVYSENQSWTWGNFNYVVKGVTCLVMRLEYNPEVLPRLPKITADLLGTKVSNLGSGSPAYSTNYALILWDYLTNDEYGRGLDASELNLASFQAARDFMDTQVDVDDTGSQTKSLMTCSVKLDCNETVLSNIKRLLKGCRGFLPFIDGQYHLLIEKEGLVPVFSIDDTNRLSQFSVTDTDIDKVYNRVNVNFMDKDQRGEVKTVSYPTDEVEFNTYLAEDNGKVLDKTITLDTVNNTAEALQAAEVILKRSRNALRVKCSVGVSAKDVSVGQVVSVSNEAFGMVDKPFLVMNKKSNANNVFDFELLEYQESIYPWVTRPAVVIPDSGFSEYWKVDEVTNINVTYPTDATAQAVISWTSDYDKFIVSHNGKKITVENSNDYSIRNTTTGLQEMKIQAINTVGYRSDWVNYNFYLTIPDAPVIEFQATNFEISVTPSLPNTNEVDVIFEIESSLNSDMSNSTNHGQSNTFTIVGLKAGTTYYIRVRTITVSGISAWSSIQAITTANDPTEMSEVLGDTFITVNSVNVFTNQQTFNAGINSESSSLSLQFQDVEKIAIDADLIEIHDDILPALDNTYYIGGTSKRLASVNAVNFYENNVLLNQKYLGIDATAVEAYKLDIEDVRDSGDVSPAYYDDKRVTAVFSNDVPDTGNRWDSAITVKGWSDYYRAWQLISNSGSVSTSQDLYFRNGVDNTWNDLQRVVTDSFDVLPKYHNTLDIGSVSKMYASIYGVVLFENGVDISSKYLNVDSLDYNTPEAFAVAFTAVDEFKEWQQSGDADTSPYTTVTESIATAFINTTVAQANIVIAAQANIEYLNGGIIEAESIVTNQLLVTPKTSVINVDSDLQDYTQWVTTGYDESTIVLLDADLSGVGDGRYKKGLSIVSQPWWEVLFVTSVRTYPLEAGSVYETGVSYHCSGNYSSGYIIFYDGAGAEITVSDAVGFANITGSKHYWKYGFSGNGSPAPNSWETISAQFGDSNSAQSVKAPSNAKFFSICMALDDWDGNYLDGYVSNLYVRELVDANLIVNGAVTAEKIESNAVTADKINVTDLSAITADLGVVTAGSITGVSFKTTDDETLERIYLDAKKLTAFDADETDPFFIVGDYNYYSGALTTINMDNATSATHGLLVKTSSLSHIGVDISHEGNGYGLAVHGSIIANEGSADLVTFLGHTNSLGKTLYLNNTGSGGSLFAKSTGEPAIEIDTPTNVPPLSVNSNQMVDNLNAEYIGNYLKTQLVDTLTNQVIYGDKTFQDVSIFVEEVSFNSGLHSDRLRMGSDLVNNWDGIYYNEVSNKFTFSADSNLGDKGSSIIEANKFYGTEVNVNTVISSIVAATNTLTKGNLDVGLKPNQGRVTLYSNTSGLSSGNITLSERYDNFDRLIIVGSDDTDDWVDFHEIDVAALDAWVTVSDSDDFVLFRGGASNWWRVSPDLNSGSSTYKRLLTEVYQNAIIHAVYGEKLG